MILTRLGNKRNLADKLKNHFPPHRLRIELFFGAGGSFFYLPIPKFAILNDLDDDVTNLYLVLQKDPETLKKEIEKLPISEGLIKYWQKNFETDPLQKALRFLLLSNFTYLGKGDTLRLGICHTKRNLIDRIEPTFELLKNTKITSFDFREVLSKISFSDSVTPKSDSFVYLDPIYLGTDHYYRVPNWTISDTEDCFKIMATCGINCAMSEFSGPEIDRLIFEYKMNCIPIKMRRNIKNNRQEILITNYEQSQTKINYDSYEQA